MNNNITEHEHKWRPVEPEQTNDTREIEKCECGARREKIPPRTAMHDEYWYVYYPTYLTDPTK